MDTSLEALINFAPRLLQLLLLVGFAIFVGLDIHRKLIRDSLIISRSMDDRGEIYRFADRHWFKIIALIIIFAFAPSFETTAQQDDPDGVGGSASPEASYDPEDVVDLNEVFRNIRPKKGGATNKELAATARSVGTLLFRRDTESALTAYQLATVLDPLNGGAWNDLGASAAPYRRPVRGHAGPRQGSGY